jgi:hypothetical protein
MAVVDEHGGDVGGDFGLLAPRESHLQDLLEAGVSCSPRLCQTLELVRVLYRAQHRQCGRHRHVARAWQRLLEAEQLQRPGRVGDRVRAGQVE